jgi:cell division protein FtsB
VSVSYYGEYKQRRQDGIWHFLNRLIYVLFVFVGITGIICFFLPMVQKQKELDRRREELNRQIADQTALLDLHTRQVDWLKDPEYLETRARDMLDLMKPNETIFRMDPPPQSGAVPKSH